MRGRLRTALLLSICAALLLVLAPALNAQGGAGDRNKAQPYFDPPREATTVSFAAIYSWTAELLGEAARPAALYYGNADLNTRALAEAQTKQLAAAERLIVFGNSFDEWIIEEYRKVNPDKPLVRLFEKEELSEAEYRGFAWMDTERARAAVARLAAALREQAPQRAGTITANEKKIDADLVALDKEISRILEPFKGTVVMATVPGLEPFLNRYGLEVGSVLSTDISRAATPAEVTAFRDKASAHWGTPVVIRIPGELPVALVRAAQQTPMRFALVDPMESGDIAPGHYVSQMRRNAINLALELRSSREIAAAFTPVSPDVAAKQDAQAEAEGAEGENEE